jgi:hypothetical protein
MLKTKYLWALVVAALCMGGMTGVAVAQDSSALSASDLPSDLGWGGTYSATVEMENDGVSVWTDPTYDLRAVEGTTNPWSLSPVDRWGLTAVAIASPSVPPTSIEAFAFTVEAPPVTGTFECDWVMANGGAPFQSGVAQASVNVTKFPDVPMSFWAQGDIENCAGMVPFIVQGYPYGGYAPNVAVTRDQMAVFIRRGMDITQTSPATATFPDVGTGYWAYDDIETLVDAGVVQGYPNGRYHPEYVVTRDQMAVFVARAKSLAITVVAVAPFDDIPIGHWADGEIQACVTANIVQGFPDDRYRPLMDIDRAQMAVYSNRGFINPGDPAVVTGGPDTTDINPATATYDGWSGQDTDPNFAYVLFDGDQLGPEMATAGGGTWDVTFDFRDAATPTITGTTVTVPHNGAALTGLSGNFTVSTPVPALAAGNYVLVAIVEDSQGDIHEVARTVAFTVS